MNKIVSGLGWEGGSCSQFGGIIQAHIWKNWVKSWKNFRTASSSSIHTFWISQHFYQIAYLPDRQQKGSELWEEKGLSYTGPDILLTF
jgi:hypothetical protein